MRFDDEESAVTLWPGKQKTQTQGDHTNVHKYLMMRVKKKVEPNSSLGYQVTG